MDLSAHRNLYLALFCAGVFPFFINGVVNSLIFPWPWAYWTFEALIWVILPIVIFGVAFRSGGLRFKDIGMHTHIRGRRNAVLLVLLCVVAGPLELSVYQYLLTFFTGIIPGTPLFDYTSMVPEAGVTRVLVSVYFALSAGFVEEMYFRGLLFKISEYFSSPRAFYLGASPVLFALIHWESVPGKIPATLGSVNN